jgi:ferritin-like metal-binding protein YciE
MSKLTQPRALFLHELRDVLYAERQLEKVLPKLAKEASDAELSQGFLRHRDETRGHIERLEQVFELVGQKPRAAKCPGIEGIRQEHDEFVEENEASPEVLDQFLTGAGTRAEHYEIASYTALITMAEGLGAQEAASLLSDTLHEEVQTLMRLENIAKRLAKSAPAIVNA